MKHELTKCDNQAWDVHIDSQKIKNGFNIRRIVSIRILLKDCKINKKQKLDTCSLA
jgi:hypothetical protein